MSTTQRLGIDIVGADKTGAAFASFTRNLKQAESSTQRLSGAFKAFAGGALAGLSFVGLAKALSNVSERMDDMGKAAQKIGVPVEQLSKLAYAARLADVPMETLQSSMGKLAKGLSQFQATGKGDAGAALRALGVSALQANGQLRSQTEILQDVAGKFALYADGANKTALAQALFGKSGAEMIPLLNGGADAIAAAADEAARFGLVVRNDAAASAEQFNDNLTRLQSAGQGLAQVIAIPLVGAFADLVDKVLAYVDVGGSAEAISGGIYDAMVQMGSGVRNTVAELNKLGVVFSAFSGITDVSNDGLAATAKRFSEIGPQIAAINKDLVAANSSAQQFSNAFGNSARLDAKPKGDAPNFNSVLAGDAAADASRKKSLADAAKSAREAAQEQKRIMSEAMSIYDRTKGPIEKYKDDLKQLDFLLKNGSISQAQYNDHVKNLRDSFASVQEASNDLADSISGTLKDEFKSWIDSALSGTFKLKDALTGLISKLADIGIDSLFSAFTGGGGGHPLYGGGGGIGSLFSGLLGFAKGGTIFPTGSGGIDSQVVAFRKSPNERVDITTPGQTLTAGSGASTIHITVAGARGNQEIQDMVRKGVSQGLSESQRGEQRRFQEHSLRFT